MPKLIESTNISISLPDKGLVGAHAFFDPAMLDTPMIDDKFLDQQTVDGDIEPWEIRIKRKNIISTVKYPYNPLDALGWHGSLMPVKINAYMIVNLLHTILVAKNMLELCILKIIINFLCHLANIKTLV